MSEFPSVEIIETAWQASGADICILVEGETELDDVWYYRQWFGDRSRTLTFFPQNGWEQVRRGVETLRRQLGHLQVYGIIDRDFEPVATTITVPADHILRTRRYALENHLLDPDCWYKCVAQFQLRSPRPAWASPELVREHITALYRKCLPMTAYNWALREARQVDHQAFSGLPDKKRTHLTDPEQLDGRDPVADLHEVAALMSISTNLGDIYNDKLAHLHTCDLPKLEEFVNGKSVIKLFRQSFPIQPLKIKAWNDMLSAYIYHCPQPPTDLGTLIEVIIRDAQQSTP